MNLMLKDNFVKYTVAMILKSKSNKTFIALFLLLIGKPKIAKFLHLNDQYYI